MALQTANSCYLHLHALTVTLVGPEIQPDFCISTWFSTVSGLCFISEVLLFSPSTLRKSRIHHWHDHHHCCAKAIKVVLIWNWYMVCVCVCVCFPSSLVVLTQLFPRNHLNQPFDLKPSEDRSLEHFETNVMCWTVCSWAGRTCQGVWNLRSWKDLFLMWIWVWDSRDKENLLKESWRSLGQ